MHPKPSPIDPSAVHCAQGGARMQVLPSSSARLEASIDPAGPSASLQRDVCQGVDMVAMHAATTQRVILRRRCCGEPAIDRSLCLSDVTMDHLY
jgi:hypothetical protein